MHTDLVQPLVTLYITFARVPQLLLLTQAVAEQLAGKDFPSPLTTLLGTLFRSLFSIATQQTAQTAQSAQTVQTVQTAQTAQVVQPTQPSETISNGDRESIQQECVELALLSLQFQSIDPAVTLLSRLSSSSNLSKARGAALFLLFLHRLLPFLFTQRFPPKSFADLLAAITAGVRAIVRTWCADTHANTLLSFFLEGDADSSAVLAALKCSACAFVALTGRVPAVQRNIVVLYNLLYLVVVLASTLASDSPPQARKVLVVSIAVHHCLGRLPKSTCCNNDGALLLFELLLLLHYKGSPEPILSLEVVQCLQCLLGIIVSCASLLSHRSPRRSTTTPPACAWSPHWVTRKLSPSLSSSATPPFPRPS